VLSPVAQRLHNFAVGKLPDFATLNGNPLDVGQPYYLLR
jgi:hypothetical protein